MRATVARRPLRTPVQVQPQPLLPPESAPAPASPAFQAGYAAGQKDARRHRRRNHVLDDLPALTAYASDAAFTSIPRADLNRDAGLADYAYGYIQAYREETGW